eukprot:CAMPEP_0176411770 /NCGR_PEP_ID=MMETSP0127-20121128/3781_1 /TAXON_ID=938130 /ORGANISM="Platyophrya macrostoma, Strain WH" /LENGTH=794 /DNA_ID=CAMNT_0017791383 /DNA_START=183 /DNA_END=2567 /DNA_ORIENTATION=-
MRQITNVAKLNTNLEKEKALTEQILTEEKAMAQELPKSSIKSKSSYEAIIKGSIKSLKSKAADQEKLSSIVSEADSKMEEILAIKKEHNSAIDSKRKELTLNLEDINKEYMKLMNKANKDLTSLNPAEVNRLKSIPAELKAHTEEIEKLKNMKDGLNSKIDSSILNSAKHYLIKSAKTAESIAVREIKENFNAAQKVDLCFLMDATGSMASWIRLTKQKVTDIISSVQKAYPDSQFFVSVVAYRDFDQGSNSFQVLPFTSNISDVVKFLSTVDARGGDDEAEDVNGGFQRLLELEWSNQTKILFHFADAPCHGPKYSNGSDKHPSPSSDMPWEKIFREIKSLGMDYYFMRIKGATDRMTSAFAEHWNTCGLYYKNGSQKKLVFQVEGIDEDPAKFFKVLEKSILDSVKRSMISVTASKRFAPKYTTDGKKFKIDGVIKEAEEEDDGSTIIMPLNWDFNRRNSMELEGKIIQVSIKPIDVILEKGFKILEGECNIMIQNTSFARGTFNLAFAAKLSRTGQKIVAKKPIEGTLDENLLKLDLKKKGIAISLANSFNKKLIPLKIYPWARISFVHTFLFKTKDEQLYLLEGFIDGNYVKYSNNLDEVDSTKEIRHFTAFAHYSYEISGGEYLVTDFQGVGGFLLTDPALHSRTKEFAESGDFSYQGFIHFFSKHRCNDLCKALGLKRPELALVKMDPWIEKVFDYSSKDLKRKCNSNFCNALLEKGEKKFCKLCSDLMTETITAKCSICEKKFSFQKNFYFLLGGLFDPKKCDDCRKKNKRSYKNLHDDDSEDEVEY